LAAEVRLVQPLPTDIVTKWHDFLKGYPAMKKIRIPMWVIFHRVAELQYHGFSDASQSAYGAAIFVRVETTDGWFTCYYPKRGLPQ